jgi:hypothetical protein
VPIFFIFLFFPPFPDGDKQDKKRPKLPGPSERVPPELLQLTQQCWSQNPADRPTASRVLNTLYPLCPKPGGPANALPEVCFLSPSRHPTTTLIKTAVRCVHGRASRSRLHSLWSPCVLQVVRPSAKPLPLLPSSRGTQAADLFCVNCD